MGRPQPPRILRTRYGGRHSRQATGSSDEIELNGQLGQLGSRRRPTTSSLSTYMKYLDKDKTSQHVSDGKLSTGGKQSRNKPDMTEHSQKEGIAWFFVLMMTFFLFTYTFHCTWVTSEAYSSPSIVLASYGNDGSRQILDDFREAYYWLWQNTAEDARVMSW